MKIYNKGGLFGLLQIEQLRDTIRNTEKGQRIIYLQDFKEGTVLMVVNTIRFLLATICALLTTILLKNIWFTDLTETTVGVVIILSSFLFPFMFLYSKLYDWYTNTKYIKDIDDEINTLAQTNEHIGSVVKQLKEMCPDY